MILISIVEDDDDIRESLALLINGTAGYSCISTYRDCETAVKGIGDDPPDVVLMDIGLPGMSGIEGVRKIKGKLPNIDIIMLTVHKDDKLVFQSLCAGACGYLMKNTPPARLLGAIKEAHEEGAPMSTNIARMIVKSFEVTPHSTLTKRETEVLAELCKGESYKMIADTLYISVKTVHFHIKNIYKKLQVHSNAEAVAKALREKLV